MNPPPAPFCAPDILVVDDTQSIRQLLTVQLKSWGCQVRAVENGALALEAAWNKAPDLILLDIDMPGMNGFEVCKFLKASSVLKDIPVIFISGLNDSEDQVKAYECGGVDYITKPFQGEDIQARIRVNLELPQQKENLLSEMASHPHSTPTSVGRRLRILVAEDNPVNQEVVRIFLKNRGHEVVVVPDGKKAVTAATTEHFDVILMDIQMPIMDGVEATTLIRAAEATSNRYTPIIALTAYSMKKDKGRCIKAGMDRFVTKPFTQSSLVDAIEIVANGGKETE